MTSTDTAAGPAIHHREAAAGNRESAAAALDELRLALDCGSDSERILLEAAAGAGKSHALKDMVVRALDHPSCDRVAIVAFTNRQILPLARGLGDMIGRDDVCLRISKKRQDLVDDATAAACTVALAWSEVPVDAKVVITTAHSHKATIEHPINRLGYSPHHPDHPFDVAFVDEAWQLAANLYRNVAKLAPVTVGVGDVGQLPPFDRASNPYRGDPGYNPTRAWPTVYAGQEGTWSVKMTAVWRPRSEQLPLWRSFYSEWGDRLHCVAAPGDRHVVHATADPEASGVWDATAAGAPVLVEVDGLPDPDAPDIDLPLLGRAEGWLDELLTGRPEFHSTIYDESGDPDHTVTRTLDDPGDDPLIAILATRNSAADEAEDIAARLTAAHGLTDGMIVGSTVDSYQGQTNAITVAVHPLSGAHELDDFNSAFGRLAVVCTRATHGLVLLSRPGLDTLLADSPARPGTPLGEPGTRELPRQTHQRILATFTRLRLGGNPAARVQSRRQS